MKKILQKLRQRWAVSSSVRYAAFLRQQGVSVREGNIFRNPKSISIDISRPSLVTIGCNNDFNHDFLLLTHDWGSRVFRNLYHDFIPSSGPVTIGNNIVFGRNVKVLKGVSIGDNCIIGAGSIVTSSIPSNSVAVGSPAKVVYSLEEYYQKRKVRCIEEAFVYARSIQERFKRRPIPADFGEEFPLFVDGENITDYPEIPIRCKLSTGYEVWIKKHRRKFQNFDAFLKEAGL